MLMPQNGSMRCSKTRRAPQQITDAAAQSDVALAVNRTGNLLHRFDIREQRLELYLLAVGLGSALFPSAFLLRNGSVGYRIRFDPGHQMVALLEQPVHHLAGGVVGIGDKVEGNLDSQDVEQAEHLVEQGALIAVGPYQTFMDAHGEQHREDALGRVYEQADSLHGMPHARCSGPIKRKCAVELKIVPALYKLLGYTPHSALAHIPLEWSKLGYD